MQKSNDPAYFDKGLGNVIGAFERAREWADLSNCLQKVKRQIEQNKGLVIPRQRDLAKRLAQCLNPEINVIHQLTLEVYREVFEREIEIMNHEIANGMDKHQRKSSIALFFSGLFNFYQFAAFEVKQSFLSLIDDCMIKLEKELILSLPGFMLCMLPALEDQNSEIVKKVEHILMETEKVVGTSEFYGEIWKAMLRTPRARLSAIRHLEKRIPKDYKSAKQSSSKNVIHISPYTIKIIGQEVQLAKEPRTQELEEHYKKRMDLQDYFYFYFPNKSTLVLNALIAGLSVQDSQVYVNRATLDFMISHMPINSEINSTAENIKLVECATIAYLMKDFASQNKISNWLFGHIDEEQDEVEANDPAIITIVESQKNLFKKLMDPKYLDQSVADSQKKARHDGSAQPKQPVEIDKFIDKLISDPIQILLKITCDEENTTIPILKHLSIHFIKYIRFHYNNNNIKVKEKFKATIVNLLEFISDHYGAVLESLANKLQTEINKLDYKEMQEDGFQQLESIGLISFAILDMAELQQKILENNESKRYLTMILQNLLKGLNKISNISDNHYNLQLMLPSLVVIEQILIIFDQIDQGASLQKFRANENFKNAIDSFNSLFVQMSKKLIEESNSDHQNPLSKDQFDTFKKYNYIMLKILRYQDIDHTVNEMPEWLDMLIQSAKTSLSKYQNMCIVSADIFNSILTEQSKSIMHIQRIIAGSSAGAFVESDFKDCGTFHSKFIEHLQLQGGNYDNKSGNSHCKEIIQNLWSNLDQEIETQKIVDLLKAFDKHLPRIFSDVVVEELGGQSRSQSDQLVNKTKQNDAIKKFTIFWKLASGYPEYRPFESPSPEMHGKKYVALHNMINFLEDTDPTLRLSCRSWLSQSRNFNRILDPIIEEFIQNSNFKITQSNHVIIDGNFETQYVIQNFGKLRNIILNTQDDIIEYMMLKSCTGYVVEEYTNKQESKNNMASPKRNQPQLPPQINSMSDKKQMAKEPQEVNRPVSVAGGNPDKLNYLDILVEITLQFIRAEHPTDGSQINEPRRDNQLAETLTVNASACEFMELILKQIEKHGNISNKIAHVIIKPLIDTFYHLIEKNNYAMQVNIINLLHLILNECNFQGNKNDNQGNKNQIDDNKAKCIVIFSDKKLIDSIILGLKCDQGFVRQKFIKFVEMLVPYLRKFTKENDTFKDEFKVQIEKLIDCFCNLLRRVDVSFFSSASLKGGVLKSIRLEGPNNKRDQMSRMMVKQRSSIGNKDMRMVRPDAQEEDEMLGCLVINQETDITLIIGGIQIILNTCLDIKNEDKQNDGDQNEDGLDADEQARRQRLNQEVKNNKGFFSIFSGNEVGYFAPDIFADVKKVIYDKIQNILIACIYCWNHLDLFDWNDYHFTRFGLFAYHNEDNKRIIEMLKKKRENIKENEKNNVASLDQILNDLANPIHKKVLQLLRSIAKKIPDQFIEGALNVWLRKSLLGKVDIHKSYEAIMQMLVCVYQATEIGKTGKIDFIMPVYQVINSMIKYILAPQGKPLVNIRRWTKNNPPLSITQTSSETLLNSFLYAYLTYNPSMFDPLLQGKSDDKMKEFQKVYQTMVKYFNLFKLSRNPFTIQWLLEILNIVSIKFNMPESRLENRQKKEYHDLLNNMLTNCASIMTETFNIQFHEAQIFNFALPPTVYEFLWRYEYMAFKNTIVDTKDKVRMVQPGENFVDSDEQVQVDKNISMSTDLQSNLVNQTDIVATNGSLFFDNATLKKLVEQQFEYQHSCGNQANANNDQSVFQNMEILMKDRQNISVDYIKQSDFMEKIKFAIRGQCNPADMLVQSKFFTIITLKQILCQLLANLVGTSDIEKCNKTMQILLLTTLQILQNDNKNQKKSENVMNEFITDFFASVVERSHQIDGDNRVIKPYRKEIVDLFSYDQFFSASMINLRQWQKIIKYFIDGKPEEMFELQMEKWNMQGNFFTDANRILVQKCYAMKRIAFLIFSCADDDFLSQLDQLLKKMIEVFKQGAKSDIKQRLFLLFLTRVMLMRLNFNALTETLRKLWPHLLNELISVFEVKQGENMDTENTDLTIEAIKLVELLASLNIEDFQMNQWIFLIDGYGMRLENKLGAQSKEQNVDNQQKVAQKMEDQRKRQRTQSSATTKNAENNDVFKTFIVRFIGSKDYSFYNVDGPQGGTNKRHDIEASEQESADSSFHQNPQSVSQSIPASPGSSSASQVGSHKSLSARNSQLSKQIDSSSSVSLSAIKVDPEYVNKYGEFDTRLQEQACSLQQSINDQNVQGNEFNRQEAEAKIEQDFLKNETSLKLS